MKGNAVIRDDDGIGLFVIIGIGLVATFFVYFLCWNRDNFHIQNDNESEENVIQENENVMQENEVVDLEV